MDDRDRAAPVALARDAPVAQTEVDLALRARAVAGAFLLQSARHLLLRFRAGHAVEETRIDHAAVAVIGGVGDDEGLCILPGRAYDRNVAEPVFADEVEVALVVRRAAEDGAGAVVHEDEIGDVDRQLPRRVERMERRDAGVEAHLLGGIDLGLRGAAVPAFLDECGKLRILLCRRGGERMIGRERHELAPNSVSGRVVKTSSSLSPAGVVFGSSAKRTSSPSERPIQFFCISRTFSGQRSSLSSASSRSSRIVGDLEEPLRQLALLDHGAGAPAAAVDHLLVGQHRLVDRVPVDLRLACRSTRPARRKSRNIACWCL